MRKPFEIDAPVAQARLYITAHGLYRAEINGQPVSDDAFTPGWTSYHRRLRYQAYDVTGLLEPGDNVIGAQLADGWFRGRLTCVEGKRNVYGDKLGLLAQLEITLTDGRIPSDEHAPIEHPRSSPPISGYCEEASRVGHRGRRWSCR